MAHRDNHPHAAAAAAAAAFDRMDDREIDNTQPNLLHVTTFLRAAVKIHKGLLGLEHSGYQDLDWKEYLLGLIGAARLLNVYLEYVHMGFNFFKGRVYCRHSGALIGILENHRLIGELNVGGWSAEEYACMSFPGQKEFEDSLRVCFWELREITYECVIILARIHVPGNTGIAAPLIYPAPSEISDNEMPDGHESDDTVDQPASAESGNADPL